MHADDARLLIEYHYWARDRVLQAVEPLPAEQYARELGGSFPSIRDTLVHLYSAEWVWHARWQGQTPTAMLSPDAFPDLPTLRRAWDEHRAAVTAYIGSLDDRSFETPLDYRTMDGRPWRHSLWHQVQHVVNHASYHRGQVTTKLRQLGAASPKSQDLIAFYRERLHDG
jgi:uncharacterized damage-inducible protein DinB